MNYTQIKITDIHSQIYIRRRTYGQSTP